MIPPSPNCNAPATPKNLADNLERVPKVVRNNLLFSYLASAEIGKSATVNKLFNNMINDPNVWMRIGKQLGLQISDRGEARRIVQQFYYDQRVYECALKCLPEANRKEFPPFNRNADVMRKEVHMFLSKVNPQPFVKQFMNLLDKVIKDATQPPGSHPAEVDALLMLINGGILHRAEGGQWEAAIGKSIRGLGEKIGGPLANQFPGNLRLFQALANQFMATEVKGYPASRKIAVLERQTDSILKRTSQPNDFLRVITGAGGKLTEQQTVLSKLASSKANTAASVGTSAAAASEADIKAAPKPNPQGPQAATAANTATTQPTAPPNPPEKPPAS